MKRQEMAFDPFQLLDKRERKRLTRRDDTAGLTFLTGHLGAVALGCAGIYYTIGTVFLIPVMLVHGIVLACLFAPMHECSHGTAFRSRWLNEGAYWLVSLIYVSQPTWYRYRHAVHHTYTQIQGKDPSMVLPSPSTMRHYIEQIAGWRFWTTFPVVITKHALGHMRPQDSWYVPTSDLPRIYNEARVMLAVYLGVAIGAIYFETWAPLVYWLIPRMLGEPVQRWMRVAEHKGCEEGPDIRTNTRSTKTNPILRVLCWNMPYHSEHHVCPQVPFFRLPELNRLVGHLLKPMGESHLAVEREVRAKFILSEVDAARFKALGMADEQWLCPLD
jgi:fatty acid desaturase